MANPTPITEEMLSSFSQHGGSLTLSSAAGKGTTVEIRLPVRVEGEAMGGGEASHVIEI